AKASPNPMTLTTYAAALALAGDYDAAIALVPKAAKLVHDNPAELFAWLLFQWGRLYEQKGDPAAARMFYDAARARMPDYVEATVHLAQTMIATGDVAAAKGLITRAMQKPSPPPAHDRTIHPAVLELAAQLGLVNVDQVVDVWEMYLS